MKYLNSLWAHFGVGIFLAAIGVVLWAANNHIPVFSSRDWDHSNPPLYYRADGLAYWGIGIAVIGFGLCLSALIRYLRKPS